MINIRNNKGLIVGRVDVPLATYISDRTKKHFMIKYQGFGISQDVLDKLIKMNVKEVIINYHDVDHHVYKCTIDQYINSKKTHTFEENDLQKFVSVKDMIEFE